MLLAEELGYKIKKEELENDEELNEDLLEAVSGGKNSIRYKVMNVALGEGSGISVDGERAPKKV